MTLLTTFLLQNLNKTKFCTYNNDITKSIGYRGSSVLYIKFYCKPQTVHNSLISSYTQKLNQHSRLWNLYTSSYQNDCITKVN